MIRMQRALTAAMALSVAMLAITARAWAGVDLRSIDVGGYPTVRFAVVTPHASKRPPAVRENGAPVVGLEAHNLGSSKSVVLAVDRSRSMAGQSLLDAAAAADSFVRQKPASDRIGIVEFGRTAVALTGFSTSTIDADGALRTLAVDSHQGTALYTVGQRNGFGDLREAGPWYVIKVDAPSNRLVVGRKDELAVCEVELRNVSFRYAEDQVDVLRDVSLRIEPGSMTALVGASGSGKTTLVRLIARFFDVSQGSVIVGGVDVRQMSSEQLAGQISQIFQDAYLFQGSIADNIRIGKPDASDVQVMEAARKSPL